MNTTEGQNLYQYGKKKELNPKIMYHLSKEKFHQTHGKQKRNVME